MAKLSMLCPFSGKLCQDCPVYRGRHFYLCFCTEYRGCLVDKETPSSVLRRDYNGKFEIPRSIPLKRVMDPFKEEASKEV